MATPRHGQVTLAVAKRDLRACQHSGCWPAAECRDRLRRAVDRDPRRCGWLPVRLKSDWRRALGIRLNRRVKHRRVRCQSVLLRRTVRSKRDLDYVASTVHRIGLRRQLLDAAALPTVNHEVVDISPGWQCQGRREQPIFGEAHRELGFPRVPAALQRATCRNVRPDKGHRNQSRNRSRLAKVSRGKQRRGAKCWR